VPGNEDDIEILRRNIRISRIVSPGSIEGVKLALGHDYRDVVKIDGLFHK